MTDHDFNGNESVIPSDIEYTLSRIGTIADSVDSSMTVGEIVRRGGHAGRVPEARRQADLRRFRHRRGHRHRRDRGHGLQGRAHCLDAHASGSRPSREA